MSFNSSSDEHQTHDALEETQPPQPTLPDLKDPRWQPAEIQARGKTNIELRSQPRIKLSQVLAEINDGERVAIIREVRYKSWIAARIGRRIGWIDAAGISFTMARMPPSRAAKAQQSASSQTNPYADLHLTAKEAEYIITHLNGIARTLETARQRHERLNESNQAS